MAQTPRIATQAGDLLPGEHFTFFGWRYVCEGPVPLWPIGGCDPLPFVRVRPLDSGHGATAHLARLDVIAYTDWVAPYDPARGLPLASHARYAAQIAGRQ